MKREIKFKIWDKITKRWLNANEYARIRINPIQDKYGNGFNLYDSFNLVDDIEIVEYTGLKDKNGKESFEKDICIDKNDNEFIMEWDYKLLAGINNGEFEITGNVYENTELLES